MSMDYIRQVFKVPVKCGMLVQIDYRGDDVPRYREGIQGKIGRVTSTYLAEDDFLMVCLEGAKKSIPVHPYDLEYNVCQECGEKNGSGSQKAQGICIKQNVGVMVVCLTHHG